MSVRIEEAKSLLQTFVSVGAVGFPDSPDYSLEKLNALAHKVGDQFKELGFKMRYHDCAGVGPYVVGEKIEDPNATTILFYTHYDVQPVDREKWLTDPFTVVEKEGRLYGRGASDDQGGIVAILTAMKTYLQAHQGKFGFNVKVLIDGDEEYGTVEIEDFIRAHLDELKANALIVMDGTNVHVETGTLTIATRGSLTFTIEVAALEKPVHSGMCCMAPDPIQHLAALVTALQDPLAIEGFMEDAEEFSSVDLELLSKWGITEDRYAKEAGALPGVRLRGEESIPLEERIARWPSITVTNFNAGQVGGPGVIQDKAKCKVQVRTLPGQDPRKVYAAIQGHLARVANPSSFPVAIEMNGLPGKGWKGDIQGAIAARYMTAMGQNFSQLACIATGGTLPLLSEFQAQYPGIEILVPGVEDPETNAHSHNESQHIGLWMRVMKTLDDFFDLIQ